MTTLEAGDVLFYALALAAVAGVVVSVLRTSLLCSVQAALASAAAIALLWARAGAPGMAALQIGLLAVAGGVLLLAPSAMRGADGDRADLLRSAAMPVAAWLVLVLRVLLMTRWPVESTAPVAAWAAPGLPHHMVLALVLLALALLSAASHRSVRGSAIAVALAGSAVATALVALSHFTAVGAAAGQMAALVVASSWGAAAVAVAVAVTGDEEAPLALSPAFSTGLSSVVAGLAFALLAGTW